MTTSAVLRRPMFIPRTQRYRYFIIFIAAGCIASILTNISYNHDPYEYLRRSLAYISGSPTPSNRVVESARMHGGPKVALMIGFPWSGQDFIQRAIHEMTQTSTGTNYGNAIMRKEGFISWNVDSVPIFQNHLDGPFAFTYEYPLPSQGYILTRSFCAGHCVSCMPQDYIKTRTDFAYECYTGDRFTGDGDIKLTHFLPNMVGKYIHLIRDPLTTVATRFEQERSHYKGYPRGKQGFHRWCQEHDDSYHKGERMKHEKDWYLKTPEIRELANKVPCHTDFYRVVHWQNLAFEMAKQELRGSEIHRFYYENIMTNQARFMTDLLVLLELPAIQKHFTPYDQKVTFTVYDRTSHFSAGDIANIEQYVRLIASDETIKAYEHAGYFSPI